MIDHPRCIVFVVPVNNIKGIVEGLDNEEATKC
jgi:hypothetical protein